jgi:hypothetical protein
MIPSRPGIARLNPAHPAAQQVVTAFVADRFVGAYDLVTNEHGSLANAGDLSVANRPFLGACVAAGTSAATSAITFAARAVPTGGIYTNAVWFVCDAFAASQASCPWSPMACRLGVSQAGALSLSNNGGAASAAVAAGIGNESNSFTGVFATGVPYFVVHSTCGPAAGQTCVIVARLDTGQVQAWTCTMPTPTGTTSGIGILNISGNTFSMKGAVAAGLLSKTYLNVAQLVEWAQDPWDVFDPDPLDLLLDAMAHAGSSAPVFSGSILLQNENLKRPVVVRESLTGATAVKDSITVPTGLGEALQ